MLNRTFIRIAADIKGKPKNSVGICFEEIQMVFTVEKQVGGESTTRVILEMNNKTSVMLGKEYTSEDDFFAAVEEQIGKHDDAEAPVVTE